MELRVLRYFLAVVAEGNISNAAQQLHISQPTISRQLKELEEELGVTLFRRGNKSIELTDRGRYLAHQANQLLTLSDKTVDNIRQTEQIDGSVYIGSGEFKMMLTLGQAIKALQESYPDVLFNIKSTNSIEVHEKLQSGIFDFGVVMDPTDKTDYEYLTLKGESRWGLLVPNSASLAKQDYIIPADLENANLIVSQQSGSSDQIGYWLGESLENYHVVATYNLLYNASQLVSSGVGYAIGIDGIINTNQSELTFVPLKPRLTAGVSLVWMKGRPLSPAARVFLDQLRKAN